MRGTLNWRYLFMRGIRRVLPSPLVRALMLRRWIIHPGYETRDLKLAVDRYFEPLQRLGYGIAGRRAMVFGYGGRFDLGAELLKRGAAHVVLVDPCVQPDEEHNLRVLRDDPHFKLTAQGVLRPLPQWMTLVEQDIATAQVPAVDVILSNSVFEHVEDVAGAVRALAGITAAAGVHVHIVDLQDHYFRYPFEMLRFSPFVWRRFLNPSTNLNRLRLWDHRKIFHRYFADVQVEILSRNEKAFDRLRGRIRPEFLSGKREEDCATEIRIVARQPAH